MNVSEAREPFVTPEEAQVPSDITFEPHRDMQMSWASREVLRNGTVEWSVFDGHQPAQAMNWMLLDIFAPFRAEYDIGKPFGSMWNEWVSDLAAATDALSRRPLPES